MGKKRSTTKDKTVSCGAHCVRDGGEGEMVENPKSESYVRIYLILKTHHICKPRGYFQNNKWNFIVFLVVFRSLRKFCTSNSVRYILFMMYDDKLNKSASRVHPKLLNWHFFFQLQQKVSVFKPNNKTAVSFSLFTQFFSFKWVLKRSIKLFIALPTALIKW